ncbi:MAG TPA: hypothetical protein VJA16_17450 [Thermoanaerobaculia bacterium]
MSTPEETDPAAPAESTALAPASSRLPEARAAMAAAKTTLAGGVSTAKALPLGALASDIPAADAPRSLFAAFNELLNRPLALVQRARGGDRLGTGKLFAGALVCYVLYGLAAGCFTGGQDLLLAAAKAPLVIALTLLLCLPSLYVFGALSGVEWSPRLLLALAAGFAGTLGLLLVGLVPVVWLFSVSSRYLAAAVWLHVLLWLLTLAFGWRFLRLSLREAGGRGIMLPWLLLFCLVSFQVATFLRPVLVRDPGEPFFATGKLSMFEHLGRVFDRDEDLRRALHPAPPQR